MTNYLDKYDYLLEYMEKNYGSMNEAAPMDDEQGGMPGGMPPGEAPGRDMPGGAPDMGGSPDAMGGAPDMGGAPSAPQGFAPQSANETPMDGMQPGDDIPDDSMDMGGDMEGGMGQEPMPADGEDVEEIDVDDLVDSQEATEHKVNKILKKFSTTAEKMMSSLDSMNSKIEGTITRMDDLEKEIAKRNPTPVEKLSLRSGKAYPFSTTPESYWEEKEATSNYSPDDDNNGEGDPQYTITKADVDAINDYDQISKSLSNRALNIKDILDF